MKAIDNQMDSRPLNLACIRGHYDIAKLLLDKGADVDGGWASSSSPLSHAAYEGNRKLVDLLLARGADVIGDGGSKCPLNAAAEGGHFEIARLLISKGAKVDRAWVHAWVRTKEWIELLLSNRAIYRKKKGVEDLIRSRGGVTRKELGLGD